MSNSRASVALIGAGPMGARIARAVLARPDTLELVVVVDHDQEKVGQSFSDVSEGIAASELAVQREWPDAPAPGSVAIHATTSILSSAIGQILELVSRGWNVVSTCEELMYPQPDAYTEAAQLHAAASRNNVTVLAAGINPGYIMDVLPLALTTMAKRVDALRIVRIQDTNARRKPLQEKAGVGMDVEEFKRRATEGRIGHVGLPQCLQLLADRLGWELSSADIRLEPVVAEHDVRTGLGTVEKGRAIGQRQVATGKNGSKVLLTLELEMSAGAPSTDEVWVDGEPNIHQIIEGGINGDIGTAAVIANLINPVAEARPGLLTMAEMMPLGCDAASLRRPVGQLPWAS